MNNTPTTPHSRQSANTRSGDDELLTALIALQHIDSLGPIRLTRFFEHIGGIENLFDVGADPAFAPALSERGERELSNFLAAPRSSLQWQAAERTREWLATHRAHALRSSDAEFPRLLKELSDCPYVIYARGQLETLNIRTIAIVGARKPTEPARRFAQLLAEDLARAGLVVVSGMALGIDTAAHCGAVNGGKSVSIWATGLDLVYPRCNSGLAAQIAKTGCIVTEMPLGTPSIPGHFPRRNRLVSGISLGVVVVEAALPSGSLITAGYAAEQGREVFAVPGSVFSPLSRGCHQLIKDGAMLVESAEDVLSALNFMPHNMAIAAEPHHDTQSESIASLAPALRSALEAIGFEPTPFEIIVARLDQSAASTSALLVDLEIQGLICVEGGLYSRF